MSPLPALAKKLRKPHAVCRLRYRYAYLKALLWKTVFERAHGQGLTQIISASIATAA